MRKFNKLIAVLAALFLLMSPLQGLVYAVSGTVISVDSVYGSPEGTVDVNIFIENNPGILGAVLSFTYDEDLTLTNAVAGNAFSALIMSKPGAYSSPCQFAWDGESLSDDDIKDGIILTLTFEISANAEPGENLGIEVSYNRGDIVDADLKTVNPETVSGTVQIIDYTPGDLDGDNEINAKDIILLRRYITGGYDITINEFAADVNDDGKINTTDVILVRRYIAGGYGIKLKPSHGLHDHTLEAFKAKDATCKEDGNTAYWYCTFCENYYSDEDGTNEIELADTVIEKTDEHTVVIDPAVPATGSSTGLTEGSHCSVCGEVFVAQEETPILVGYAVTYNVSNNDTYLARVNIDNGNPTSYTTEEGLTLKNLKVPGYNFLGWFTLSSGGTQVTEIPVGSTGDIELYAQWSKVEYEIIFDSPDVPWDSKTYTVDKGATLTNPSWFGYTFVGWSDDNGFIKSSIKPGTVGNITLHANWTSNRNKATSYSNYGSPIIIEADTFNQFLFVYDIGKIDNVPLSQIEYIGNTQSLVIDKEYTITETSVSERAETIANMVSNATTRSSGWTLSKEWESIYEAGSEYTDTQVKSEERTDSEGNVVGGNYFVSNSEGGSSYVSNESGGSYASSSKVTTDSSKGINYSYDTGTEKYADAKLGVTNTTEVGAEVKVADVGLSAKNTTTISAEASSGRKDTESYHIDGSSSSYIGTVDSKSTSGYYNTVANQSSNWNSTTGYSQSYETSRNTAITEAISKEISKTTAYNLSEALGGGEITTEEVGGTDTRSEEYSSVLAFSDETAETTTKHIKYTSDKPGYYRLVMAGTVHVYGVVGYDIATGSYYTYTFNVLADDTYEYLDYSMENANFDDCENGVVTFEIPYEVNEYILGVTGTNVELEVDLNNTVTSFTAPADFDGSVVIPQYYSVNNLDVTYSAFKTTGISADLFRGNTTVKKVILPLYVTEIPDNAFEGCTALEEVIAFGVTKIGSNAFKGCTSLKKFSVDNAITELGTNAFEAVPEIEVMAASAAVADNVIASGADKITLNLSYLSDSYDNKKIVISDATSYFGLISNGTVYNNLQIESEAAESFISNMTFANNTDTPLKLNSSTVTLARVTVENSPGFALVLEAESTELALYGEVKLSSLLGNTVLSRSTSLSKANSGVTSSLIVTGKYLICGEISNTDMLGFTDGTIDTNVIYLIEKEYEQYLTSITVTFDANGGTISDTEVNKTVYYGQTYGTLPEPVKANYTFGGWYTEGGEPITSASSVSALVNQTLYARWIANAFTVTFDANGGSVSPENKTLTFGETYGELPTPTREHYTFNGWYTEASGGSQITADTEISEAKDITVYAQWTLVPYTVSWNTGTGYTITVKRTGSPNAGAATGTLSSGATIYYGDVLSVTYTASTGYSISSTGITSVAVAGNITSSSIYANAGLNSYTYNIVYKSSNGTSLGTSTATYKYGTTNTVYPKSISGYTSPSSQSVKWDSVSAKTITFIYTPTAVATTQNVANGTWWYYDGAARITYSVNAEYRNRTANTVQIRFVWTNSIVKNYYYGYAQYFYASAGGVGTGDVTIASSSLWAESSYSARSKTVYSGWITVPVSTGQQKVSIGADFWDSVVGKSSWNATMSIPTY